MDAIHQLLENPLFWPMVLGTALLLLLGIVFWIYRHKTARQRQLQQILLQLGNRYLKDVVIPDGIGGQIQIDYLIATAQGLLVLDLPEYDGVIFGGEKLEQWVNMSEGKSYRFPNPLYGNTIRTVSVRELVKDVPVLGRVGFHLGASFPKGRPEGVTLLADLANDIAGRETAKSIPVERIDSAWAKIHQLASPSTP